MAGLPCIASQCAKLHVGRWTWAVFTRVYLEFCDIYSVSPEKFGSTHVYIVIGFISCNESSVHGHESFKVFWDVTPCRLLNRYGRFERSYTLYLHKFWAAWLNTRVLGIFETSAAIYWSTRRNTRRDLNLQVFFSTFKTKANWNTSQTAILLLSI
jgi:hypothetical protein